MFLPTLGPGRQFVKQFHMETSEFAVHLRELLISWGYPLEKAAKFTSHSFKATFLSWTAKAGVDRELQRILGYHAKPGDKTIIVYQRDAMAEPLRQLAMVLRLVRDKEFDPGLLAAPHRTRPGQCLRNRGLTVRQIGGGV